MRSLLHYRSLHKPASMRRRATATVEAAICLPVLFIITLGTIDICSAIFLKETLTIAAYEGARVGSLRGGTNEQARTRIRQILDERGIHYANNSISISNPSFESASTLQHVAVKVAVRGADNLITPSGLLDLTNFEFSSNVTMRKEYEN